MKQNSTTRDKSSMVEQWKHYVIAGNQGLLNKEYRSAARQYELARQCAENLFVKWGNPDEAVSALVVTYHNIADLHRKQGNAGSILYYLEKAHDVILRSLISTPIGGQRYLALMGASKKTYSALVSYKKCGVYN